jgi:hypothetical protein
MDKTKLFPTTRALTIEIRDAATRELAGVALLVPAKRMATVLVDGADQPVPVPLAESAWSAIEAWTASSDAALPARPKPLDAAVVTALVGETGAPLVGERIASFPTYRFA